jgi:SAM-dependent methyltransferase
MGRAGLSVIKAYQQRTWASGDYAVVAARIVLASELLADAADLKAGWQVLDVACGNGDATLAAARCGTYAFGIDYVPGLLEGGRARGGRGSGRRVPARRHRGPARAGRVVRRGAERLRSDVRARSSAAADEIIRAARPGGTVGLASWTPNGFIGQMFGVITRHVPGPPGVASPLLWGTEQHLSDLFGAATAEARPYSAPAPGDSPPPRSSPRSSAAGTGPP